MYESFTDHAQKVLQLARQEAQRFNAEEISTEHLLLGIVKEGTGMACVILKRLEIDLRRVRIDVENAVYPVLGMVIVPHLDHNVQARKAIELAIEEAQKLGYDAVGTGHLLLGLLRQPEEVTASVLNNLGVTYDEARQHVQNEMM